MEITCVSIFCAFYEEKTEMTEWLIYYSGRGRRLVRRGSLIQSLVRCGGHRIEVDAGDVSVFEKAGFDGESINGVIKTVETTNDFLIEMPWEWSSEPLTLRIDVASDGCSFPCLSNKSKISTMILECNPNMDVFRRLQCINFFLTHGNKSISSEANRERIKGRIPANWLFDITMIFSSLKLPQNVIVQLKSSSIFNQYASRQ
ncbi:hypothetical protein Nepgr_009031 [Nepenthes gracilis]|uniref:Uncharacterized protein n=1 Tax=Nepenthes gracilis TaxID=150966 RepID=A0AAD3SAL8_NEPGR|nr:hypothetical protein Nepgr_009031 [Nepenthes gracilis]